MLFDPPTTTGVALQEAHQVGVGGGWARLRQHRPEGGGVAAAAVVGMPRPSLALLGRRLVDAAASSRVVPPLLAGASSWLRATIPQSWTRGPSG